MPLSRTLYNIYTREGRSWLNMPDSIRILAEDFGIFQFPYVAVDSRFLHTCGGDKLACGAMSEVLGYQKQEAAQFYGAKVRHFPWNCEKTMKIELRKMLKEQ